MIEKAYLVKHANDLKNLPIDANRIYLGSEHCIKAFPYNFNNLLNNSRKRLPVSVVFPPILESETKLFFKYLGIVETHFNANDELILNDWGTLYYIHKTKKNISVRLGRFFSYQKRGTQKRYETINDEDLSSIPILDKKSINFLKKYGITGIEIDYPLYGLNIKEKQNISISVYTPLALNSYTLNCYFTFDGKKWNRKCKRECLRSEFIFCGEESEESFIQKGKIYYTTSHIKTNSFIDRVVDIKWQK